MRSAPAANRIRHVGSVTWARYRETMLLTNCKKLFWFFQVQNKNSYRQSGHLAFHISYLSSSSRKTYCLYSRFPLQLATGALIPHANPLAPLSGRFRQSRGNQ